MRDPRTVTEVPAGTAAFPAPGPRADEDDLPWT